jgi:GNAT superfamily N-acetyltransferase
MELTWHRADESEVGLLAEWNHQLIRDEGRRNAMSLPQLAERMRGWLRGEYTAIVFSQGWPVAYALYREGPEGIDLRQFFVERPLRRTGLGTACFGILREKIWPADRRLRVEALCGNPAGLAFWRKMGCRDYSVCLEIMPEAPASG